MIITENPGCPQQYWCRHRCGRRRAVTLASNRPEGHISVAKPRHCRISIRKKSRPQKNAKICTDRRIDDWKSSWMAESRQTRNSGRRFSYLLQTQHSFVFVLRETVRVTAWHFARAIYRKFPHENPSTTLTMARSCFLLRGNWHFVNDITGFPCVASTRKQFVS